LSNLQNKVLWFILGKYYPTSPGLDGQKGFSVMLVTTNILC